MHNRIPSMVFLLNMITGLGFAQPQHFDTVQSTRDTGLVNEPLRVAAETPFQYFSPVEPTVNSYPVIIQAATSNDEELATGDEIGVFDRDLCVGAAIVTGTISDEEPLEIITWEEDPENGLPGFRDQAQILFYVWQDSADFLYIATATFRGSGIFGEGENQVVTGLFADIPAPGQPVHFDPVHRTDQTYIIEVLDASIAGNNLVPGDEIAVYDGDLCVGASFVDADISGLDPLQIIAWKEDDQNNRPGYLAGHRIWLKMWSLSDEKEVYGQAVFTRGGYFELDESSLIETLIDYETASEPVHFQPVGSTDTPYPVIVESAVYSEEIIGGSPSLDSGDEIALFDGDLCVGARLVLEPVSGEAPVRITAWGGDGGFAIGNPIRVQIWSEILQKELDGDALFSGNGIYGDGDGERILSLEAVENSVSELGRKRTPDSFAITSIYPNPFNPSTTISFQMSQRDQVTITIYNISGETVEQIYQGIMAPGMHQVPWYAKHPTGTYFVRVTTSSGETSTQRLVLMK